MHTPKPRFTQLRQSRPARPKRSRPTRLTRTAVLMILVVSSACSELAADSPLVEARRTPEALARAALDAVVAGDDHALASLMIRRDEYETLLWPSIPDRQHVPFAFVWSITGPRSRKARTAAIAEYRDLPLELVRVELGDEIEEYDEFVLHRDARMWVRRTDTGAEGTLPLMDVLVEMNGGWKFLNFHDGN